MRTIRQLFRHRQNRIFVLAASAVTALASGCVGLVFPYVWQSVRQPIPYPTPSAIVNVALVRRPDMSPAPIDDATYHVWSVGARSVFSSFAEFAQPEDRLIRTGSDVGPATTIAASAELFDVLGASPLLGTTYLNRGGALSDQGALVSYGFFRSRLGARGDAIGQEVTVDGVAYRILGVLPPGFRFPLSSPAGIFVPLPTGLAATMGPAFTVLGRIRLGVSVDAATRLLRVLSAGAGLKAHGTVSVVPYRRVLLGGRKVEVEMLGSGSVLVFLVCWANLLAIAVTFFIARREEMWLRRALGAGRRHLARPAFATAAICAAFGGASSAAACFFLTLWYGTGLLPTIAPEPFLPALAAAAAAAAALICVTAIPVALAFAWSLGRGISGSHGARLGLSGRRLLALEIGMLVPTTVLGALFAFSAVRVAGVNPGLDPRGVTAFQIEGRTFERDPAGSLRFLGRALERIRSVPGVLSVSATSDLPLAGRWNDRLALGLRSPRVTAENCEITAVTPGYFQTLDIQQKLGRTFSTADGDLDHLVVVVDQTLAELYWPGSDPVGKVIWVGPYRHPGYVIGVVSRAHPTGLLTPPIPQAYIPISQEGLPWRTAYILIKTRGSARVPLPSVAEAISEASAAASVPVFVAKVIPVSSLVALAGEPYRHRALIWNLYAAALLALVAVSIYSTTRRFTAMHRREFAVRSAIGASPGQLMAALAFRYAFAAGTGLTVGAGVTVPLVSLARAHFYGLASSGWLACVVLAAGAIVVVCALGIAPAAVDILRLAPCDLLRGD